MNKKYKALRIIASCLGFLFIMSAFISDGISFGTRIVDFLLGLTLIVSIFVPIVRWCGLTLLSLIGICLSTLDVIKSGDNIFTSIFIIASCVFAGSYFGYKAIKGFKVILNSPDTIQSEFEFDPLPCQPNTQEHNYNSEQFINYALVEYLVSHLGYKSAVTISLSPRADSRDDFAKYGGVNAELLTIDLMEGHDFEYWCANALEDIGFTDVHVTPGSGDQGVDILATLNSIKYAIQCKRYSDDLGNTPVQEVHAGKYIYHCHVAAVITNRHFTKSAKELADATGVLLWDRDWIEHYLKSKSNEDGSILISHSPTTNSIDTVTEPTYDDMIPAAIDVILESGQASVSILQRKLLLGYARCARIIDEMEELGIVGPFCGSQPRIIYLKKAEWDIVRTQLNNI